MTVIVGVVDGDDVWMGGDSAGVSEYVRLTPVKQPKVFRIGQLLIGYTDSFRMGQLLQFPPPDCVQAMQNLPSGNDAFNEMVCFFVPWIRELFKSNGFARKENEVEAGGQFLVGYRGRLFRIESDFAVIESHYPFDAIGCGADLALGSILTSSTTDWTHEYRVRRALEASQTFSACVRGPFTILKLEK